MDAGNLEDPNKKFVGVLEIPRLQESFKIILSWNRLGVMMAPQVIHLEICSVGRYSPTKLRNGAFLLAES